MASSITCPNGHISRSTDYCDTCGSPIPPDAASTLPAPGAAGGPAPGGTEQARALGVVCPNCGISNAPGALFCEACGYDYTTGTMPRPAATSVLDLDTPVPPTASSTADLPAAAVSAAEPATPEPATPGPAPPGPPTSEPRDAENAPTPSFGGTAQSARPGDSAGSDTPPSPDPGSPPPGRPAAPAGLPADPPPETESDTFEWVLEIWVDPEWYALQGSPDPMPSPGLPDIVPLRKRSLLIGRPSRSRNIDPDIDCEPDTGISRRQAELSTDGTRWFIEDLGSANGTYVADAAGGLPAQPVSAGRRHELHADVRLYLGAWTRLVLRRATSEEKDAYAAI